MLFIFRPSTKTSIHSSQSKPSDDADVPETAQKKYDPDLLTPSDVRELNLILLDKFREAMYLG